MANAFPTESVRLAMTAGQGAVSMVSPIVKLQGIGVNVPSSVASDIQRQEDEMKKRRAAQQ
jgi:hypothetical protein